MGKSILQIIAENELNRIKNKNLATTDDVQNSQWKGYANDFGIFQGLDYSNDTNKESPNVIAVGDKALKDSKDLNVFAQKEYRRYDASLGDASVIDMPEIDEISKDIYLNNVKYNKYCSLDYLPYSVEAAIAVGCDGSYGDYIEKIKQSLNNNGTTLANVFQGIFNQEDSPIGTIGEKALNNAMNVQVETNLKRETLGRINNQVISLLQGQALYRPDYDISKPKGEKERTAEFLASLAGFQVPVSYLPNGAFEYERLPQKNKDGSVSYIGSNLTSEERTNLLLEYTGLGQQQHLINLLKLNLYHPKIIGSDETIDNSTYVRDYNLAISRVNTSDFVANQMNTQSTGRGFYEPYGVTSIHKASVTGQLISDKFEFAWTFGDINRHSVGWTTDKRGENDGFNKFDPKSLLFKTQELLFSNPEAFMDMNAKEHVETSNGESITISRGDSTTAANDYIADDGTAIAKGEYFRVWTKKRKYDRLDRTLRHRALDNGDVRSVLNDNGLVNIAPTTRRANATNGLISDDIIKRYMFSIENLAWNDHMNDLPECEQGIGDPVTGTRGRLMWFPPYDLKIDDNTSAPWEATQFIGRGEPVYTYKNAERSATLSFTIIVDHPDVVHQLVGEKTHYWERYFKGDKSIEDDVKAKRLINKKLSQNEIEEIEKIKKQLTPIVKVEDGTKITEEQKTLNDEEEVSKKADVGDLGNIALSIYFPNAVTVLPESSLNGQDGNLSARTDLSSSTLKSLNIGYEDGGKNDGFNVKTSDGYTINTGEGIKYFKNGKTPPENGGYTYLKDKLVNSGKVCTTNTNSPEGYHDENNNGLNEKFYFQWQEIFKKAFEGATKVQVTFMGNASGAKPTGEVNKTLAEKRSDNAKAWFVKNVKPLYPNIDFGGLPATSQAANEDAKKKADDVRDSKGNPAYCQDCDRADNVYCKQTRKVDIYVKVLAQDEEEVEPIPSSGSTDVPLDPTKETLTTDTDETDTDTQDTEPVSDIDPAILKKLVYTECDFFEYLEKNQPLVYQTISERIKYFWAAYHSITPQGFNSRLTFLNQCLRQGDSIGKDGTANWKNLAFGRPPVCILRIGDFYHTRIIIESLNISYDVAGQITWDLNPEGIGVQPMLAKVSMGIKILGGSSMTAPINRLQNAMSFNYYANTEMYDGRADSVVFVDSGKGDTDTFGTQKNGKIVDGIKLSSITNFSQSQQQARLAKLRKQGRITLPNSTNVSANIETAGEVGSLLEMKKRLGLSMTGTEKIDVKTSEATANKFSTTKIEPITLGEVKNSSITSLKDENSELNQQALLFNEGKTNKEVFDNYYNQWMQATVSDPSQLTSEGLNDTSLDFLQSNKEIYFDDLGNRIDFKTT
jgi:hypothetical protein